MSESTQPVVDSQSESNGAEAQEQPKDLKTGGNGDSHPILMVRGGDSVDARSLFDVFRSRVEPPPIGRLRTAVESMTYHMSHRSRGKCLIFNHKRFDLHTRLNERRGTEADGRELAAAFRSLDFDVSAYPDPSARDIVQILETVSKENHSDRDCLVVCILSHGEQGVLWARDEKYMTDAVFNFFKGDQCPTLAGKPKMFFIQACQGDKLDSGVTVHGSIDVCDAGHNFYRIPNYADFLIAYSTVPGYYSWRNTNNGSWFIQSLTKVLAEYASRLDLLTMLTVVSRMVAYDFESNVPNDPEFHQKKQIPCVTSMLTRLVYFTPKV